MKESGEETWWCLIRRSFNRFTKNKTRRAAAEHCQLHAHMGLGFSWRDIFRQGTSEEEKKQACFSNGPF